ncbi:MAG: deoxyribose-phosphate aldolase [Proteobacteria bacterium]|jgi:deoxyribose-phosphate aldolase|nr:deoxyribose-phosphate aldolase [Pseudomonadota bacterium]
MEPNLASYIDHTLLKPDVTPEQIEILCREAAEHRFFGVCINSSYIALAKKTLSGTPVKVVSVIGFPLGVMETSAKAFEAQRAVQLGADEIDMVIHIGQLKAGNFSYVKEDIKAVVTAAQGKPVKVILETCLLSEEQKRKACEISVDAGAHFVKTSTGFGGGGATTEDIALMRSVVGPKVGVKASGGVKTTEQAWELIKAGANRLGTSSGVQLIQGKNSTGGY